ncbi:restriction endonuclease [Bacillus toyonensis]|uniref:restriction endonuclease subunit S n=1 Tax=Bacillus toyonensis TaxID=155322 RepID=UPI000BEFF034|nr:restriction endonuclease subunit S [Bacillus toyonensis]PEK51525.1 restriction endonuclease [Bacillus toyonensis]
MKSKHTPEIRFAGFTVEWEQRRFENVLNKQDGIRRGPFGSALKKEFFVKDSDYAVYEQQNAIYDNYETRYNITKEKFEELKNFQLSEGDFILSGAGTIGRISRVPKGIKQGVFNQALIRFKIDEKITDSEYFVQWVRSENMQRKFTGANPGSAITNLVPMSEVKKWDVMVPSKNEQIKIGKFFKQLDDIMALLQQELTTFKQTKQGFLQKMFPKEGEIVPEVRFPGFTGDWEQRKLGEFVQDYVEKTIVQNQYPVLTSSQKRGIVYQEEYFADRQVTTQKNIGYFVLPRGYFTFRSRSDNGIFKFNRNDLIDKGIISYFYPVFRISNGNSDFFLNMLNSTIKRQVALEAEGTGQRVLSLKKFKNINVVIPEVQEQIKIGKFFKQLDDTIVLHQRELDALKETKKAFLQKMFA